MTRVPELNVQRIYEPVRVYISPHSSEGLFLDIRTGLSMGFFRKSGHVHPCNDRDPCLNALDREAPE